MARAEYPPKVPISSTERAPRAKVSSLEEAALEPADHHPRELERVVQVGSQLLEVAGGAVVCSVGVGLQRGVNDVGHGCIVSQVAGRP